jgi:signal peptidase II
MKNKIWFLAIIVIIVDQITKQLILSSIEYGTSIKLINNFLYLNHSQNKGAAWGIFQGKVVFLILVAILFLVYLIKMIKEDKKLTGLNVLAYGLLLGGVFGNLADRIVMGYVVDFIEVHIFNYIFPIFNLADMAIVTGTFLMVFLIIKEWWVVGKNNSK